MGPKGLSRNLGIVNDMPDSLKATAVKNMFYILALAYMQ